MDTDDLTDEAHAIIAEAHQVSGILGAELALSGAAAHTEAEFLERMSTHLQQVASRARDCWEDYDGIASSSALRTLCRSLSRRIAKWPRPAV